jgi:predicted membrane channel-forming protein YqfA (hemolysin III family)
VLQTGKPSLVVKLVLGGSIIPFLPAMAMNMTTFEMVLLAVSWVWYVVGLVIFKTACVDPFRCIFGFHEASFALKHVYHSDRRCSCRCFICVLLAECAARL